MLTGKKKGKESHRRASSDEKGIVLITCGGGKLTNRPGDSGDEGGDLSDLKRGEMSHWGVRELPH